MQWWLIGMWPLSSTSTPAVSRSSPSVLGTEPIARSTACWRATAAVVAADHDLVAVAVDAHGAGSLEQLHARR